MKETTMKTQILTLALTLAVALSALAETREGMHQMPDGTWMSNHAMEAPAKATPTQAVKTSGKTITATVNGLVCDFCAQSIKKTLKKNPEVEDVQVDLTAKTVVVGFKGAKVIDEAALKAMLKEAGYDMTSYKVE